MAAPSAGELRHHFEAQAKACDALGSPFTAKLCRMLAALLDESTETGRRAFGWAGDIRSDALALRLCGGLHALALSGEDRELAAIYPSTGGSGALDEAALRAAIIRNDAKLAGSLDSAPQTNETARAGMLLPGFLVIAGRFGLPLEINEIGASAGLNLNFDRFHYDYGQGRFWGQGNAAVRLRPELRARELPLDRALVITGRHGCDIRPADILTEAGRLRLRSYVWPDQADRLARLDAAIELARRHPCGLEAADAADFLLDRLEQRGRGACFVLFHSIMWQYLPAPARAAIEGAMLEAGNCATPDAPLAWLRMEPLDTRDPHATLTLTLWPSGETRHLAHCDYHGRWLDWLPA